MRRLVFTLLLVIAITSALLAVAPSKEVEAAPEDAVSLVHVEPSGTDYTGNPYCPDGGTPVDDDGDTVNDRAIDDCNNIVSQNHVIRTKGWDPAYYSVVSWNVENASGATATIIAQGECGTIAEVTGRAGWSGANDDEQCIIIHSSTPGETRITFTYDNPATGIVFTDPVVKEWDSLLDTVILKAEPSDVDDDGDIDADDHHLADQQGTWENAPVIWDEALKRVRSYPPLQLIEIVHGEHDVLIDAEVITLHQPSEGAIIRAWIDSDYGCTYFTTRSGIHPAASGSYASFGTIMTGVSDMEGRFVGPAIAPDVTMPAGLQLQNDSGMPISHNGPTMDQYLDYDIRDIYVDTFCEEQAEIHIEVGYPGSPGSLQVPAEEWIGINWVTVEEAKQPQVRWAGEEIVLAKRWALPDDWFPNSGQEECPLATIYDADGDGDVDLDDADLMERVVGDTVIDYQVYYVRKDPSPGALEGAYIDSDGDGFLDSLNGGGPDQAVGDIDRLCISKALYLSEEPGQVDVEAKIIERTCPIEGGPCTEYLLNKHAFLVWYLKIYQVKLSNVEGEREFQDAGRWSPADPWDTSSDVTDEERNLSSDALVRVRVKGWFESDTNSGRGAVCVDLDGDGDEAGSAPGEPYPLVSYDEGCTDLDDEILDHGHWVLPDDLPMLAGAHPGLTRSNWDVMQAPDGVTSDSPSLVGPKSTLDSHDPIPRPWIPCLPGTCPRKTVVPDGAVDIYDALMPPLKIKANIAPGDAGFLREASKKDDVYTSDTNLYYRSMVPAEPEVPPFVTNGGYDWDSWLCRRIEEANLPEPPGIPCPSGLDGLALGPYEFWHVLNKSGGSYPYYIEFYTDNRGEGMFFVNGDHNLSFEGCAVDPITGTPDCSPGNVVGRSTITVIGDYPYFRKHLGVQSNPVVKTWIWGEPSSDADLQVVGQHVENPPAEIALSGDIDIMLVKLLHNDGPYSPVDAASVTDIVVPEGCTIYPSTHIAKYFNLPVGLDILHHEPFTIHCYELGEHTFVFDDAVTVSTSGIVDPDPSNDAARTELTVAVVSQADVKITGVGFVDPPAEIPLGQDVDITLRQHMHNNGPRDPVDIAIDATATAPTDCTIVPKSVPNSLSAVPVSVDQVVDEVWTINCTDDWPPLKTFRFDNSIGVATPFVSDLDQSNNSSRKWLSVRDPFYPYWGDEICDGQDNDADTVIDEGWDLSGSDIADCLDPALDTDGDTLTNDVDEDDDGDGWSDVDEGFMRTDPLNACPLDAYHDAWPPDVNNDGSVDILDVLRYKPVVRELYDRRYDLNADGSGDILDVLLYKPIMGMPCANP